MTHDSIDSILSHLYHPGLKRIDLGLSRVEAFLHELGDPHLRLPPVVHVAGTNGKGSLIAYLQAICEAAGLRVHRYTSPHLVRFNERIVVAGKEIGDEALRPLLLRVEEAGTRVPATFFESTTAAAFLAFAEIPADIVLLETGMGGRLDATNVIAKPILTAITPVAMDHAEFLGDTLEKIAAEKAGILKPNVPCVIGPQTPEALAVIKQKAQEVGAPLSVYGKDWEVSTYMPTPSLPGEHQRRNAATAAACADILRRGGFPFGDDTIQRGIASARWPARLQRLTEGPLLKLLPANTELWLDGGHNPHAAEAIAEWAKHRARPLHVIFGMLATKDIEGYLRHLQPHIARLTAIPVPEEEGGHPPEKLAALGRELGLSSAVAPSPEAALRLHPEHADGLICGSLYLAGYVLRDHA